MSENARATIRWRDDDGVAHETEVDADEHGAFTLPPSCVTVTSVTLHPGGVLPSDRVVIRRKGAA